MFLHNLFHKFNPGKKFELEINLPKQFFYKLVASLISVKFCIIIKFINMKHNHYYYV